MSIYPSRSSLDVEETTGLDLIDTGGCGGLLRPDVVWFGEVPPLMGEIARHITNVIC